MSFSHEVVVLYILKLYGIVELQFMLGCLWKQFVISVSLLFRLWQDLSTRTHLGMTACQGREEICDGGCTATSGWSCPSQETVTKHP